MPSWFIDKMFGKDPSIMTKEIKDTAKTNVSNPLSAFLAQSVGKGLPRYGGEIAPEVDPNLTSRYNEFLSLNANDLFDRDVANPATKKFKEEFLPEFEESFAGGLRGSGRFRGVEDQVNKFATELAGLRYKANTEIPLAQMAMAKDYYAMRDVKIQRQYQDWFKSLPENNPMLEKALQFLSNNTGTGTTVLSGLDPGTEGWFGDLLNIGVAAMTGGMGGGAKPKTDFSSSFARDTMLSRS